MALVRERHHAAKKAFEDLLNSYAQGDQQNIIASNERLRTALHQLESVVAVEHWPAWLKDLVLNADRYVTHHNNGLGTWRAHLNSVIKNADELKNEDWSFTEEERVLFDADAIVAKAKADNKVDELYDKIVACLQSLLESGEIDSVRASADLNTLIATLRKARTNSFSSQVLSWRFARRLMPNIISAYIKRSSVTGPLIEAFEQTATELDVSLEKTKDQIGEGILSAAASILRTDTALAVTQESALFLEDHTSRSTEGEVDVSPPSDQ